LAELGLAELTGKQRRYLRALGHHLVPVLHIGHEGLSDAVVAQTNAQLEAHELIKVKVGETSPVSRHDAASGLADATGAAVAQVLGRTFLLYRRRAHDSQLTLPG
jgi:RNA-binding protein